MAGQGSTDFLEYVAVVIDPGSAYTRAGLSGEEHPRAIVRSSGGVTAYRHQDSSRVGNYRGHAILDAPDTTCPPCEGPRPTQPMSKGPRSAQPISEGLVSDWAALEQLISYLLEEELSVCPRDHALLATDCPLAPPTQRPRLAELLFETFGVPALHFSHRPVVALYSYGRVSGLLVDAGASGTRVCPVYDGYCLPHAARSSPVGGDAVSAYLRNMLGKGEGPAGLGGGATKEELKRRGCCMSQDYEWKHELQQQQGSKVGEYRLPDGTAVTPPGDERFRSADLLFQPALHGYTDPGAHILALSSLQDCNSVSDCDLNSATQWQLQRQLLANVAVCGGSSLLPGFPERLQGELERLAPPDAPVCVLAGSHRYHAAWLGGAVVSCLSSFRPLWVTHAQYEEKGADAVLRGCY